MKDLHKLKEIYKILKKALKDIDDVDRLSDYDLDCEINDVFNTVDDLIDDVYRLIKAEEKKQ